MTKPKRNPSPLKQSKTAGENWIQHVFRAGGYSLAGIATAFKNEMAFRMEAALAILMIPTAFFLPVPVLMKAILVSSVFLVLIVELLNSGLEWVIDYISLDHHPFAKMVKDMGSAAVFFALLNAGAIWGLGLLQAFGLL